MSSSKFKVNLGLKSPQKDNVSLKAKDNLKDTANDGGKSIVPKSANEPSSSAKKTKQERSKKEKIKPQYKLDTIQANYICNVPDNFNAPKCHHLCEWIDRLNVILCIFSLTFIGAGITAKSVKFSDFVRYIFYFGCFAWLHLVGGVLGLLFTWRGNRIYIYASMLINLAVIISTFGYLLHYSKEFNHFKLNTFENQLPFSKDLCFQSAIAIYMSASILLFIIQLMYSTRIDLFTMRFQLKLSTINDHKKGDNSKPKESSATTSKRKDKK